MTRRQGVVTVAVLAVLAVALVAMVVALVRAGAGGGAGTVAGETHDPAAEPASSPAEDPVGLLESAGVNVVAGPPLPAAPEEWGDYRRVAQWARSAHVDADPVDASGPEGSAFPATSSDCGQKTYLVTFRSAPAGGEVEAQLVDASEAVLASEEHDSGWTLGTNCATPRFAPSSSGGAGPVGVDYTVTEYRRVTTPEADEAPAPSSAAGPTFVECLFGTPGPARFSDGSIRNHRPCTQSPEAQRSLKAERVCGGLYGWREVSAQEYRDLCGGTPPTDAGPPDREPPARQPSDRRPSAPAAEPPAPETEPAGPSTTRASTTAPTSAAQATTSAAAAPAAGTGTPR